MSFFSLHPEEKRQLGLIPFIKRDLVDLGRSMNFHNLIKGGQKTMDTQNQPAQELINDCEQPQDTGFFGGMLVDFEDPFDQTFDLF